MASENKRNEEPEIYKLSFMSTIAFPEKDKKKLMSERDSVLKKNKDHDTNAKLGEKT